LAYLSSPFPHFAISASACPDKKNRSKHWQDAASFGGMRQSFLNFYKVFNNRSKKKLFLFLFQITSVFIKPIRTVSATTFATITSVQVVPLRKAFVTLGRKIKIFALNQNFFVIFALIHLAKLYIFRLTMFIITSKYLLPKGYRGLTLFPFIIVRNPMDKKNIVLINHEKIHIQQQLELLVLPFYIWYLGHFFINLFKYKNKQKAYLNIIFEKEAYQNEHNLNYLKTRKIWGFMR
jgi:hypothetical protein